MFHDDPEITYLPKRKRRSGTRAMRAGQILTDLQQHLLETIEANGEPMSTAQIIRHLADGWDRDRVTPRTRGIMTETLNKLKQNLILLPTKANPRRLRLDKEIRDDRQAWWSVRES